MKAFEIEIKLIVRLGYQKALIWRFYCIIQLTIISLYLLYIPHSVVSKGLDNSPPNPIAN